MPVIIRKAGFDQFSDPSGGLFIKALIMGDHGVGKTPSAACWPKPIIADCEKGVMSVAAMGTPYATIGGSADMKALIAQLRIDSRKAPANRDYQTLIIDTVDTYQRKIIQERLRQQNKERLSGWEDWGHLDAQMTWLLEAVLSLDMNVVVNMHTKDVNDGEGDDSILVRKARLKGDIKDAIFQDFDLIGQMEQNWVMDSETKERVRVRQIRWHGEPKFPALRDRSNKLPQFTPVTFTPADYQVLFDHITSGIDELPESEEIQSIATEDDGAEIPDPGAVKSGPLADPKIPPAKKAAAAKKTAAKKTESAPEPAPEPAATPVAETPAETPVPPADAPVAEKQEPPVEDPWAPPADAAAAEEASSAPERPEEGVVNGKGTAEAPIVVPSTTAAVLEAKIVRNNDHIHSEDGECLKNTFGPKCGVEAASAIGEVVGTEPAVPAEEAKPEPAPVPDQSAAPKAAGAKICGSQPDTMIGKFEPKAGCGRELNAENAVRMQIGMLRLKTFLCDDCHDAAVAA